MIKKIFLLSISFLFISKAYSADFTIQLQPAASSVGDSQVTSLSTSKIDNLLSFITNLIPTSLSQFNNDLNLPSAYYVGSAHWNGSNNCAWIQPALTNWANFPINSNCPNPSVSGKVQIMGSKRPGFVLPTIKAGVYKFDVHGAFLSVTAASSFFRISDGSKNTTPSDVHGVHGSPGFSGQITYSQAEASSLTNVTFQIQALIEANDSNSIYIYSDQLGRRELSIDVYYYPEMP